MPVGLGLIVQVFVWVLGRLRLKFGTFELGGEMGTV